jgi:deoxyribodipyrimidine photo-lyase
MPNLVWFRTDLRVRDNPALYYACQSGPVEALFVLTPSQWLEHTISPHRLALILRTLDQLSHDLAELGIPLKIVKSDNYASCISVVVKNAKAIGATGVFFNDEVALNEARRDGEVIAALHRNGIACETFNAFTCLKPGSVRKPDGSAYSVFTPFKRRWLSVLTEVGLDILPAPKAQGPSITPNQAPAKIADTSKDFGSELWKAGERTALSQLNAFCKNRAENYQRDRDIPNVRGTSGLSPQLAMGTISANQCLAAAYKVNGGRWVGPSEGINTWVSEIIWREFYNHILVEHPRLAMGQAFRRETDSLPWNQDTGLLERWQKGETGLPLVDAGMRQLNSTGWMHNRLRMVTAQFLAKHLFLDWRLGEQYFMSKLVDCDIAANNGGWQWSASTGTDAVPYFRMFNPIRQAERFDANGDFVRSMVPELANAGKKQILEPWKAGGFAGYPEPIIDLAQGRDSTLATWKTMRAGLS